MDWFLPFVAYDEASFLAYLDYKSKDAVWGDDPEIQVGVVACLLRGVWVLMTRVGLSFCFLFVFLCGSRRNRRCVSCTIALRICLSITLSRGLRNCARFMTHLAELQGLLCCAS